MLSSHSLVYDGSCRVFFVDALFQAEEVPFYLSFLTVFFKNQGQMSDFVKWMGFFEFIKGFSFLVCYKM